MEPDFLTAVRNCSLPGFGGFLRPGDFANPTPFAIMHVMNGLRPEETISLGIFRNFDVSKMGRGDHNLTPDFDDERRSEFRP